MGLQAAFLSVFIAEDVLLTSYLVYRELWKLHGYTLNAFVKSQVMNLWCRHQGIARDTLQISYKGQELLSDDTAAKHGWSPGEVIVLDAILASDVAAAQAQDCDPDGWAFG